MLTPVVALGLSALLAPAAIASPHAALRARNIVYDGKVDGEYDFVIAGGGTAGLALAARLSEDANTTVLVLEAGDTGDAVKKSIDIPGNAYYSSLLNTPYDWQYMTVPQTNAGGRVLPWPRGKVLGGSSAVNGLYVVRPSAQEVNAWSALIGGSELWTWDALFKAMKQSESFSPPTDQVAKDGDIRFDAVSHGSSGPVHVSYPGFVLPVVGNWTNTLEWIGIDHNEDPNGGNGWGGFVATSAINPSNWTRSYSRSAYIDPLPFRPNLSILPNSTATRILLSANSTTGKQTATGVEYAASAKAPRVTVKARREVIVSGGAIGSPQLLMLSGIGPKDVLDSAGVQTTIALPGVGQHLQDHISAQVVWKTSEETAASIHGAGTTSDSGASNSQFLSFINSATAYANVTDLLGPDFAPQWKDKIRGWLDGAAGAGYVPSKDAGVVAGYKAITDATLDTLLLSPVGQVELLLSLTGTAVGGDSSIAIQAALQHPFSHGRLYINSSDPFAAPVIDPGYLSHPADVVTLREGLKLARKLGQTQPLASAMTTELSPGTDKVKTDEDWDAYVAGAIGTEYHPSCSCAMLPQDHGGVVDEQLRVYGTDNLRVVDASVFPIQFAAHLQAPVYGLAEQAANIIRAQYNGTPKPTQSQGAQSQSASATAAGDNSASQPTGSPASGKNGARGGVVAGWSGLGAAVLVALLAAW